MSEKTNNSHKLQFRMGRSTSRPSRAYQNSHTNEWERKIEKKIKINKYKIWNAIKDHKSALDYYMCVCVLWSGTWRTPSAQILASVRSRLVCAEHSTAAPHILYYSFFSLVWTLLFIRVRRIVAAVEVICITAARQRQSFCCIPLK